MRKYDALPKEKFVHGNFYLQTIDDSHIESVRLWRNAQMAVLRQKTEISSSEQITYFEKNIWSSLSQKQPRNILLSFFENDVLVGYGGLVHIAWEDLRAEVSFLLNPIYTKDAEVYGKYFSAYLGIIKNLAFSELGFNRLFTETFAFRIEHIKILEKNGFVLEGTMRNHVIIDGVATDSLIHGCLKE